MSDSTPSTARPWRGASPKASSTYRLTELYLFIPFGLAIYGLAIWGFRTVDPASSCHAPSLGAAALKALMLVARSGGGCTPADLPVPMPLLIAQFLLPLLLVLGTVFTAVKIVLVNLRHDTQIALARTMHGHTIICGLGETGLEAVRQLALQHGDVIAISLDPSAEGAKICESLGVPLLIGDATLPKTLAAAGLRRARAVVMCTGLDSLNLEICLVIDTMKRRAGAELLMFPEMRSTWIFEILGERTTPIIGPGLQLHPFRASEAIARKLLCNPVFFPVPQPKLVFLGFDDLAQSILRRAVLSNYALPGTRAWAKCVDAAAAPETNIEAPGWWQFADLEFISHAFGAHELADAACLRGIFQNFQPDIVIISLGDDDRALRLATATRGMLDALSWLDTAIFVHVDNQKLLSGLLGNMADMPLCPDRLAGFGDLGEVVAPASLFDEQLDTIARNLHDIYLAHSAGDLPARLSWEKLPERYRRSSRAAADHIPAKLHHAGLMMMKGPAPAAQFSADDIERMAAAEHYRWSLGLRVAGWRQAVTRDDAVKTHPLLVAWEALPEAVRQDNRPQAAAISAILARAGFTIRRIIPVQPGGAAACGPAEIPCFEIDPTGAADYAPAEAWVINNAARAVLRRGDPLRAEDLRKFAQKYPRLAQMAARRTPPVSTDK